MFCLSVLRMDLISRSGSESSFPQELSGLYTTDEMEQANEPVVKAPQAIAAPNPEHLEAEAEVLATRPPAPEGAVYIEACTPLNGKGKKAGTVTLSTGEECSVWQSEGQLFDLAIALCQEGKPVKVTLQRKGDYPPTLKTLARLDAEHDQRVVELSIPIDASDIPF